MHHCTTTGNPSASKYSACHWSTPTAEREPHTPINLMPTCDGWPRLLETQTWESPPNLNMSCCQRFLQRSLFFFFYCYWMQCGSPYMTFCGNNPIHHTYHIRNHNCFSDFAQRMNIYRGVAFERRSNWFFQMQMSHYQMRLTLVVRFEVLSERLFVPSSFAAHLIDRLTIKKKRKKRNLPQGTQRARLMSYLLGPALARLELC